VGQVRSPAAHGAAGLPPESLTLKMTTTTTGIITTVHPTPYRLTTSARPDISLRGLPRSLWHVAKEIGTLSSLRSALVCVFSGERVGAHFVMTVWVQFGAARSLVSPQFSLRAAPGCCALVRADLLQVVKVILHYLTIICLTTALALACPSPPDATAATMTGSAPFGVSTVLTYTCTDPNAVFEEDGARSIELVCGPVSWVGCLRCE
jgi:hypothetical protein